MLYQDLVGAGLDTRPGGHRLAPRQPQRADMLVTPWTAQGAMHAKLLQGGEQSSHALHKPLPFLIWTTTRKEDGAYTRDRKVAIVAQA